MTEREQMKASLRKTVCAWLGHSAIVTTCFGYVYCGRCKDQIGDTLGGVFSVDVLIGHDCPKCRENYAKTTWKDRLLVPYPLFEDVGSRAHRISRETGRDFLKVIEEETEKDVP